MSWTGDREARAAAEQMGDITRDMSKQICTTSASVLAAANALLDLARELSATEQADRLAAAQNDQTEESDKAERERECTLEESATQLIDDEPPLEARIVTGWSRTRKRLMSGAELRVSRVPARRVECALYPLPSRRLRVEIVDAPSSPTMICGGGFVVTARGPEGISGVEVLEVSTRRDAR